MQNNVEKTETYFSHDKSNEYQSRKNNWTDKKNTNRDRASNISTTNVEINYKSTTKMFLKIPRNKRNASINRKTIRETAPAIRPSEISHYQIQTHIILEELSAAPEAESTIVLITLITNLR